MTLTHPIAKDAPSLLRPPARITAQEIEQAVQIFWPRFDTHEIATIYGWHESYVANALTRLRDGGRS